MTTLFLVADTQASGLPGPPVSGGFTSLAVAVMGRATGERSSHEPCFPPPQWNACPGWQLSDRVSSYGGAELGNLSGTNWGM